MAYDMKDVLAVVGAATGCFSFGRLLWTDIRDRYTKPHLSIEFDLNQDLREWDVIDAGRKQKVATVHIRNKRRIPAVRCVAVLRVISAPLGVTVGEKEFSLHWADTDYSMHSNVAKPVDIGLERRRLDVLFTFLLAGHPGQEGAWVAMPMALSVPSDAMQAYLPPGEYRFQLTVACANGRGASKEFLVSSPRTWNALSMRSAK
jgi:hypothetical protein